MSDKSEDMNKDDMVETLRRFLKDYGELNRILDRDRELEDDDLEQALEMAVDEFDMMPPILSIDFSVDNFPSKSLLLHGAAIWALESAGILQSRNRLNYSDGGIQVQVSDKAQSYQSWIQMFLQRYQRRAKQIKRQLNLERAYGNVHSEYLDVDAYSY